MGSDGIFLFQGLVTQIKQIAPWYLAGTLTGSLISVYLSDRITQGMVNLCRKRSWLIALLGAACLGVISPVCLYGTIPLIAALGRKGVQQSVLTSFMISSILLNPNLFLVSFALGAPLALARLTMSLAAGVLAGVLAQVFLSRRQIFKLDSFAVPDKQRRLFWRDLLRSLRVTSPYFLAGMLLAALLDLYFPRVLIEQLFGANQGLGVLFAVSVSIPTYVCGGGTVPLLNAWLQAGMSTGSAIAYMAAGPATKITNLGAVKSILGWRFFLVYLAFCIAFAVLAGLLADLLMT